MSWNYCLKIYGCHRESQPLFRGLFQCPYLNMEDCPLAKGYEYLSLEDIHEIEEELREIQQDEKRSRSLISYRERLKIDEDIIGEIREFVISGEWLT